MGMSNSHLQRKFKQPLKLNSPEMVPLPPGLMRMMSQSHKKSGMLWRLCSMPLTQTETVHSLKMRLLLLSNMLKRSSKKKDQEKDHAEVEKDQEVVNSSNSGQRSTDHPDHQSNICC